MLPINAHRNELSITKYYPITHLNSPSIFESRNGMMGTVIKLEGVPFDTEKTETVNHYAKLWHHAVKGLTESIALHITLHRHKINPRLPAHFDNTFCQQLDEKYHAQFATQSLYKNEIYLTLLYKGVTTGKSGKLIQLLAKASEKAVKEARHLRRRSQIAALEQTANQFMSLLSDFKPHIIGSLDTSLGYSELTYFLGVVVNGGQSLPFKKAVYAAPLSQSITALPKEYEKYPQGNLAHYVTQKRIFMGRAIQFQGATDADTRYAAILSVKRYENESHPLQLDGLLHLDAEFIVTHTFAVEARDTALHLVKKQAIQLRSVEDAGVSQIDKLAEVSDKIAAQELVMGYHHHTLMLLGDSLQEVDEKMSHAVQHYAHQGIAVVREDIGQEAAFWAQIPTNIKYIARNALITSLNFTDFCPLHNYRMGYRDGNHLGSAVTLLETPAKTPFFFNFHTASHSIDKQNPTAGHTTIIGGNGSGKTALMAFLDAQASRYGGKSFFFDRNRGLEIYIRACGGFYTTLSPNETTLQLNPLQLEDTPVNRKFCQDWLVQLVRDDNTTVEQSTIEALKNCVDYVYEKLAPCYRNLTHAVKVLPSTFPRRSQLKRFLRATEKVSEGEYAYLFDNEKDTLQFHKKMGFDMTHFLDNEPSHIRTALMMYIMHRLKLSMDGNLLSIYLDEGWQYLQDDYWEKQLKTDLPTLRKNNAHIILATQSPATVVESKLRHVILDNAATQIFFSNPQAKPEHYLNGFNLTEEEFDAIRTTEPSKRLFLVKQQTTSSLCRLNLSTLPGMLAVLSGNLKNIKRLDAIRAEVGDDAAQWLPIFEERIE